MKYRADYYSRAPLWKKALYFLKRCITSLDIQLLVIVSVLSAVGFVALFSAAYSFPWRIDGQIRNLAVAALAMLIAANIPTKWVMKASVPLYLLGVALLVVTLMAGVTIKGATRWLDFGFISVQPSEIMKLATPMALAWYFQLRQDRLSFWDFAAALVILAIPTCLILDQPDLGTALLVVVAGFSVIFFAGISWKFLAVLIVGILVSLPVGWSFLYDYQKQRIITLLDPSSDPLGKGFHSLQAMIAIGSGGLTGKGWMNGTQAHLDFIPERTSDFLFAVYSEEFGFLGNCVLVFLYLLLIARSLYIAVKAPTFYQRLLASAIAVIFLTYSFVNIGMVSGILPVVGVPLPFMSYGGTALLILGVCCGILMRIASDRGPVNS